MGVAGRGGAARGAPVDTAVHVELMLDVVVLVEHLNCVRYCARHAPS